MGRESRRGSGRRREGEDHGAGQGKGGSQKGRKRKRKGEAGRKERWLRRREWAFATPKRLRPHRREKGED